MPSAFGKFLDAVADALGFSSDESRRQTRPRAPRPEPPRAAEPEPAAGSEQGGGPRLVALDGYPITPDECRTCGYRKAKPEHYNQFCSYECERRFGDSMDAWHDQFEERFGEGDTYEEWRARIEAERGPADLADTEKRAREKD